MLVLRVTHGLMLGQHYELHDDQTHMIGRNQGAVALMDDKISRKHAELTARDGGWYINDLESTNGTFVNGQRIVGPTVLSEKDVIQVGMTVVLIESVTTQRHTTQPEPQQPAAHPAAVAGSPSSTATQPIAGPYTPGTGQLQPPTRRTSPTNDAVFTGTVSPAAWALIGYSVVAVAGVLLDIVLS